MYQDFFHFARKPFQNTADPVFFYPSAMHREALATLTYGIDHRKGLTVLIGPVGSGKTNLIRKLTIDRSNDALVQLPNPQLAPDEFLDTLCRNFSTPKGTAEPFQRLEKRLRGIEAEGKLAVLVIDEAHLITEPTLEILRLLLNFESDLGKLLQIVLSGQEELLITLEHHKARPLRQRVALIETLDAFNFDETLAYVQHRLRVAGGDPFLFPRNCIERIYEASEGLPRLINQICDNALIFAFGRQSRQVELSDVQAALAKLPPMVVGKPEANRPVKQPIQAAKDTPKAQAANASKEQIAAPPRDQPTGQPNDRPGINQRTGSSAAMEPPSSPPPMPFNLPSRALAPESNLKFTQSKFLYLFTLVAVAALSAGSVWWVLTHSQAAVVGASGPTVQTTPKVKPDPVASQFNNAASQALAGQPGAPPSADKPNATNLAYAAADNANFEEILPLPTPAMAYAYRITQRKSYADEMTKNYGSMNLTVREIVGSLNPDIDLRRPPLNTTLQLPDLTRQDLVISDSRNRFFIYYGSYPEQDSALVAKKELTLSQQPVIVVKATATSPDRTVWRVYIGPYTSKAEAESITNLLRFKNVPNLE